MEQITGRYLKKSDFIFLGIGLLIAAMPYLFPGDFIFFRFIFFTFLAFEYGSRAGLITTVPLALIMLVVEPDWESIRTVAPTVFMAMIFAAPFIGFLSGKIRKHEETLKKLMPVLMLFGLGVILQLYLWVKDKPGIIKAPFIFIVFISFFFLFRYRKNLIFIRYFFWLLAIYYVIALLLFFVVSRFGLGIEAFYNSLVFLLPGDILSVFLAAVFFPQLELIMNSFRMEKSNGKDDTKT